MIDFATELEAILTGDPLGLLEVKATGVSRMTSDERLAVAFEEVNAYVRRTGRPPERSSDIHERRLFSRLQALRESAEKAAALAPLDEFKLLEGVVARSPKDIKTIDDVLDDDVLGILDEDEASILSLTHVPKSQASPDFTAKRQPCEDFEAFEPLFKQHHADLATGTKTTVPFTGERQISPGSMFVLHGMLVYVANRGKWQKKNFGNVNARLYCVFENGTESNLFLRSLAAALWKAGDSRQVIEADQLGLLEQRHLPTADDADTGHIYVLRSLSDVPKLRDAGEPYKIGFSAQPVRQRIEDAATSPTFLMSDVVPVIEYQTYNLNLKKMELLLHTFFAEACLDLEVLDRDGARHRPREWFVVPLEMIEAAVQLLISGEIVDYRYDSEKKEIIPK
jgi:T5orf172 domain